MSDLSPLAYQSGFGNEFATEALGLLPTSPSDRFVTQQPDAKP